MKKIRKLITWAVVVAGVAALVYLGMRPEPLGVDVGTVTRGTLRVTVDEDGETRIRDPYLISAPLAGRLLRVELEPGDSIARDDVLAMIDPGEPGLLDARTQAEAEARVSAAEANYQSVKSQLDVARAELEKWARYLERDERRLDSGAIAQPTFEDTRHGHRIANSNFCAAESALEVSRFQLDQAKAALVHSKSHGEDGRQPSERHFVIKSPIDGVILRKFQESSTVLAPGTGILEIGDPGDLEIRIDVLSQDAVKIEPGQRVVVEHWGGDKDLVAHVRRVEPSAFTKVSALGVDEQRVWVYADFAEDGPELESLGDAYRVEARIVVWEEKEVTRVPSGALFREGEAWAVYLYGGGRAERRKVRIGRNNGIEAEVLDGLEEGDRVVLHPGDRIREGSAVKEREA